MQLMQITNAIENQEINLWELIDVEYRLGDQIQSLEYALKHINSIYNETQSAEEIFASIDGALVEYEANLWQLLEDKATLEMEIHLLRTNFKIIVKAENTNFAFVLPNCDDRFDENVSVSMTWDDVKPDGFVSSAEPNELLSTGNVTANNQIE